MSDEPKVFMGLTQSQIDAKQPGPCIVCEATDYPLSVGGPSICPACDCGVYTDPKSVREIREAHRRAIDRIKLLEARLALRADVPRGWKLVPVEPTSEMKDAGGKYRDQTVELGTQRTAGGYYRAMVAAAPAPPSNSARSKT